jgi:hypothetical protein
MLRPTRLWRALEAIPGLQDVPAWWEHFCGDEFPLIQPYLLPTNVRGHRYPCPRYPRDSQCPRRIIHYGDGEFAAICQHRHQLCERIPLTPKDALIHTLDVARLAAALAPALRIRPQKPREFCGLWEIGVSIAPATRHSPAFLAVANSVDQLQRSLHELLLSHPTPFLLLAPTSTFLTADHLRTISGSSTGTGANSSPWSRPLAWMRSAVSCLSKKMTGRGFSPLLSPSGRRQSRPTTSATGRRTQKFIARRGSISLTSTSGWLGS